MFIRKRRSFLALVLVFSMLIALSVPVSAVQEAPKMVASTYESANQQQGPYASETLQGIEVVEKREENVKHFLLENGLYEAVLFPVPVHYQDDTGKLSDIDNGLKDATLDGQSAYENKAGTFKARLAKNANPKASNWLVDISKAGYGLKWRVAGDASSVNGPGLEPNATTDITATIETAETKAARDKIQGIEKTPKAQRSDTDRLYSSVTYQNLLPGLDFEYALSPTGVKENILIAQPVERLSIALEVSLKNLIPKQEADGTVLLVNDSGETVMAMPRPNLLDQTEEFSYDVTLAIELTSQGTYLFTYTPSEQYLKTAQYPVVLDPVVQTTLATAEIRDASVFLGTPSTNYQTETILYIGNGSTRSVARTFLKYRTLPTLTPSQRVHYAELEIYKRATTNQVRMQVHRVLAGWDSSTITWNNKPAYDTNIEAFSNQTNYGDYYLDITGIAQEWMHDGVNNGLMLRAENEATVVYTYWSSDSTSGQPPVVRFQYSDYAGLESYWSTHSVGLARGAALHVNDFNGNLVATVPIAATSGNRLPLSLDLIFNSTVRGSNLANIKAGNGWRTSYDRSLRQLVVSGTTYYAYVDGDGTEHYFRFVDSQWIDEEGLGLTLNTSTMTITDKKNNRMVFTNVGPDYRLSSFADNQGNTAYVAQSPYSGVYYVSAVQDPAGKSITINRDGYGQIQSITDPAGRATTVGYSGTTLTSITYPDTRTLVFGYDGNGNLSTADDSEGVRRTVTYQTAAPFRVTRISKSATSGSVSGGYLDFSYSRNKTSVTDHLGKRTDYQFNYRGDTLCVIAPDGSAGFASYNGSEPYIRLTHTASQVSNPQKFLPNRVSNHGADQISDWVFSAADGTAGYATDRKHLGSQSLKLYKTTASGSNSATQTLTLSRGQTYTFSAYISTESIGTGGRGAGLDIAYESSAGIFTTIAGRTITGTQDFLLEPLTFTVPAGAYSDTVKVTAILGGATGSAWFDSFQLESGKAVNRYNVVLNSDFDQQWGGVPTFWARSSGCTSADIVITDATSGKPSDQSISRFRLTGSMSGEKYLEQTFALSGGAGDTYVFGAWGKGRSVPITSGGSSRFAVELGFISGAGTDWKTLSFNEDSSYWQYVSGAAQASGSYTSIKIRLNYSYNANAAEFDAIQLYKEAFGSKYEYDTSGNLTKQTSGDGTISSANYSSNNLIDMTLPNGQQYTFGYDGNHNITSATSATGVAFSMVYDQTTGNLTSLSEGNTTTYVKSQASYTANGNFPQTMTDPFGQVTSYIYNETKGTLSSTTLPNSQAISYGYDTTTDALTSVSATTGGLNYQNSYTFENNNRLATISHTANGGNVLYSFVYNELGWRTTTTVASQPLMTTVYELVSGRYTGRVLRDEYGNGQTVSYDYDSENRISGIRFSGTLRYEYAYDATGALSYIRDARDNSTIQTVKDLAGRLSEIRNSDGTFARYTYNSYSQFTKLSEFLNGGTYVTEYGYDNDYRPTTATWLGSHQQVLGYDSVIDRISSVTRKVNGVDRLVTSYAYKPGAAGVSTTSKRIDSVTNTGKNAINYSYDSMGNISVITQGTDRIEYYYDGLSQLIRENYSVGGTSYTKRFIYDAGGNIQSRENHPYTMGNGTLGTPTSTDAYGYDTTWRDILTSFNGQAIQYDAIGNPTSYLGKTLAWTMGRQLESYSDATNSIQYTYNSSGIRTKKVVNGVTTTYHLMGNQVTMEQTGTNTPIYYAYDGNGNLFLIQYNGQNYFYSRNAQNDIIGLVDGSGNWVVEYAYDAWGKPISTTGSLATTLGVKNPYRYRGYRFDTETGLYYLNSRYYDPQVGRFLNVDALAGRTGEMLGHNVFAYCKNNPINMKDPCGYRPIYTQDEETEEMKKDSRAAMHPPKAVYISETTESYLEGLGTTVIHTVRYSYSDDRNGDAAATEFNMNYNTTVNNVVWGFTTIFGIVAFTTPVLAAKIIFGSSAIASFLGNNLTHAPQVTGGDTVIFTETINYTMYGGSRSSSFVVYDRHGNIRK